MNMYCSNLSKLQIIAYPSATTKYEVESESTNGNRFGIHRKVLESENAEQNNYINCTQSFLTPIPSQAFPLLIFLVWEKSWQVLANLVKR